MLHAEFEDHRTLGSREDCNCFAIYDGQGGHLDHVKNSFFYKCMSPSNNFFLFKRTDNQI